MNSGRLRHRLSIQRRDPGTDALGQPVDSWGEHVEVWGQIDDLRGRQYIESRETTVNEVTTQIRIRYRTDIVPEMRVIELCHAHREFDVADVQYTQPPRPEVLLDCLERRVAEAVTS